MPTLLSQSHDFMNSCKSLIVPHSVLTGLLYVLSAFSNRDDYDFRFTAKFDEVVLGEAGPIFSPAEIENVGLNADTTAWFLIKRSVLPMDSMYNDSVQAQRLEDMWTVNTRLIEIQMYKIDPKVSKETFETKEEHRKRLARYYAYRDSLISTDIRPYEKQLNSMSTRFYRVSYSRDTKLGIDLQDYDADRRSWKLTLLHGKTNQDFRLTIDPANAKEFWQRRDRAVINSIANLEGIRRDVFELIIEGFDRDTFLLVKRGSEAEHIMGAREIDEVMTKVSKDADFPGGGSSWTRYITREIERNIDELQDDGRSGTVVVLFIVDKDGAVSDVRALPCTEAGVSDCLGPESVLAKMAVNAIRRGPNWIPAELDGRKVKAYKRQTLSFQLSE